MNVNQTLTIVGGGATTVAFLHSYLELVDAGHMLPSTIYLCEKRGMPGPGAAYEPDLASNILNTKTGFITPFHDRPGDFFKWLQANQTAWRSRYPDFLVEEHGYAPRPLFGMYLRHQLQLLVHRAASRGVNIIQIRAEVTDVSNLGHGLLIKTDCNLDLRADYVFFFCGTLAAKPNVPLSQSARVLSTPYPVRELPAKISVDAAVGIAGARLSCIDAVVALVEQGHRGPITIHARSGYFPSVRGTQGRIEPRFLTIEQIESMVRIKGKLRLADFVDLVQKEISQIGGDTVDKTIRLPAPPTDLAAFLREEIALAAGDRPWQAVLYSTNRIIDRMWAALHDEDKLTFLKHYFSVFMAYRVSIPVENARKILGYVESGQVRFCPGGFNVRLGEDGRPELNTHDGVVARYDYLINAMGSPRNVSELNSTLLVHLLQRGSLVPHPLGGVQVDEYSYSVLTTSGQPDERMRVVGELTTGAFFFTSALDINARHARQCAQRFADFLRRRGSIHEDQRSRALA
jgi:uncharacterized NAD(P)/FAD-binding protein YdhS